MDSDRCAPGNRPVQRGARLLPFQVALNSCSARLLSSRLGMAQHGDQLGADADVPERAQHIGRAPNLLRKVSRLYSVPGLLSSKNHAGQPPAGAHAAVPLQVSAVLVVGTDLWACPRRFSPTPAAHRYPRHRVTCLWAYCAYHGVGRSWRQCLLTRAQIPVPSQAMKYLIVSGGRRLG
jgi:hypothetical protein